MNRSNLDYIEGLYLQYKSNPESVTTDWKKFFEGFEFASDGSMGLSEKELDVYNLINAYRNYGHFEAQLDPLTNTASPSDQLSLGRFNFKEADLDQKGAEQRHFQGLLATLTLRREKRATQRIRSRRPQNLRQDSRSR